MTCKCPKIWNIRQFGIFQKNRGRTYEGKNVIFRIFGIFWDTVRTVNSRQKKGLNRAVETTFLSERDAAVESGLSKVRQENVLLVIYSLYLRL